MSQLINADAPACIRLRYGVEVRGKDGTLKHEEHGYSRSLVRAFGRFLQFFAGFANVAANNTSSVSKTLDKAQATNAAAWDVAIGTGAAAVAIDDDALGTEHATVAASTTLPVDSASEFKLRIQGAVVALGTVTITEVGLYAHLTDSAPSDQEFLMARDVLGATVAVVADDIVLVRYEFDLVP